MKSSADWRRRKGTTRLPLIWRTSSRRSPSSRDSIEKVRRHELLSQLRVLIPVACKAGDLELAKQLCDELNALSTLKFDPTKPDGTSVEFDVEEWYWEARKRVYSIIA